MTAQLAEIFPAVVALDVSQDQIDLAKRLLGDHGRNVTFHKVDQPFIPLENSSCSAMFSSHVFQHLPDFIAVTRYLRETFRVLKSDSTACFHLPVRGAHRTASSSPIRLAFHNAAARVRRMLGILKVMEYHRYSPELVFEGLHTIGFCDLELRIFDMSSNHDAHSYFFARRP